MNVLDENIPDDQRSLLRSWRIRTRQIGRELGGKGLKDPQIISLLQTLTRPTFFTLDDDFLTSRLCHPAYAIVYLDVSDEEAAVFVRRVLRHPGLNTQAKRMGTVVKAGYAGLRIQRRHETEHVLIWP